MTAEAGAGSAYGVVLSDAAIRPLLLSSLVSRLAIAMSSLALLLLTAQVTSSFAS